MTEKNEVKNLINEYHLRPVKSLGQNFLTDARVLKRIISLLDPEEDDLVIEVGPGTGALTEYFAGKFKKSVLIEIDRHLIPVLKDRFGSLPGTEIIHADAFKVDFSKIISLASGISENRIGAKLVSNLPYYATNQLIQKFITTIPGFNRIVVTVQTEAAQRITSGPNSEGYGIVPVLADLLFDVSITERIPPHCFYPQPGVESSVMLFNAKESIDPDKSLINGFTAFLKIVFGQRRKKMSKLIKSILKSEEDLKYVIRIIEENGYPETVRAQEITPAKLWEIYNATEKLYAPEIFSILSR